MRFSLVFAFVCLASGFVISAIGMPTASGWHLSATQISAMSSSGAVVAALLGPALLAVLGLMLERILGPVTPYVLGVLVVGGLATAGYFALGGGDAFALGQLLAGAQ